MCEVVLNPSSCILDFKFYLVITEEGAIKLGHHVAISLAVSGILYLFFRSVTVSVWTFIGGTLVDFDHLYDYARHPHRDALYRLNIREFFNVTGGNRLVNVYVFLHSWELVVVLLIAGWLYPAAGLILVPLAFGFAIHFFLDVATNPTSIECYSFGARLFHRFSGKYFYRLSRKSETGHTGDEWFR
jgi:hypothetical protein